MDAAPQPDLPYQLPRDLHYTVVHALSDALPPPVSDSAKDRIRRDNAIIGDVASLRPASTAEAILAAQCIAANIQSLDCLRLARLKPSDVQHVLQCTAQSASMMRQSRGALGQLLRLQAARLQQEPDTSAGDAAAMEQTAAPLIADTPLAAAPPARTAEQPAPQPVPQPKPRILTRAEEYALADPSRATLIRSLGRLPKKFHDPAMSPALAHEVVNSDSPILQALVKRPAHRLAATA
jgi:hypothetical protein